jgi:hypothetical protein
VESSSAVTRVVSCPGISIEVEIRVATSSLSRIVYSPAAIVPLTLVAKVPSNVIDLLRILWCSGQEYLIRYSSDKTRLVHLQ